MRGVAWLAAALAIAGCVLRTPPPPSPAAPPPPAVLGLRETPFSEVPGWGEDDFTQTLTAFRVACGRMEAVGPLGGSGEAATKGGHAENWLVACRRAATVPEGDRAAARAFFETSFRAYAVANAATGDATGLFTGYYEPEVAGNRVPSGRYRTPLLGRPSDLMQVDLGAFAPDLKGRKIVGRVAGGTMLPYFDRAEIEAGALAGQRLELLFLADPVDAFVLQIQGSGRVRLPDGRIVRVNYAAENGRPYVAIGRVLVDRGELKLGAVTMQAIEAWLAAHPDQAASVMDENPSYVFFTETEGLRPDEGPPGSLGAKLTPGRSAAVDHKFIPLGAPLFIATTDPLDGAPLRRLLVAGDTGGAIRGPVRADLFWGWGKDAETRAGLMKATGKAWILLPAP